MASRKIEDLHQVFQPMVRSLLEKGQAAIKDSGWIFFITDGFRSFAEQTELYAQGRTKPGSIVTNAKAGQSAHNFGLAVDLAFQKDGKLSYDPTLYAKIYPIARTLGFELGADWTGFTDEPHFEHPNWEKLSNSNGGSNNMANMYKGYDLNNPESMKVAVDILVRVQGGEFIEKSVYEKAIATAEKSEYERGLREGKAQSSNNSNFDASNLILNGVETTEQVGQLTVKRNYAIKK